MPYSLEAATECFTPLTPKFKKDEEGYDIFSTLWKYDCNPADYKKDKDGKIIKYPAAEGLSEIIATPTYYNGKVYVAIGQDPEHGEGLAVYPV